MIEPFYRMIGIKGPQTRTCDWTDCHKVAIVQGSYFFIDNNIESSQIDAYLCQHHGQYIKDKFDKIQTECKNQKNNTDIKRVIHGITRLDANNPIQKFDVEDYRVATFHFYITAYQGPDKKKHEIPKTKKDVIKIMDLDEFSPVIARAYIEFNNRFEWLVGNKKYESKMYMGELFTFTNSDVSRCIRIVLEKHSECEWVDIELDILKEPR